ncbi:hypothetical protein C8R46DRAFT_1050214, partial [Mycena filopes]
MPTPSRNRALSSIHVQHPFDSSLGPKNLSSRRSKVVPVNLARKVTTDLPEISPHRPKGWKSGEDETLYMDDTHRGRAKVHALQAGLRKQLLECENNKEFWDFVRKRTDPRAKKSK